MIFQDVLSRELIETNTINKFKYEKNISVLCDKKLVDLILDSIDMNEFTEINFLDLDSDELIISKVDDKLVCEAAKSDIGEYKFLEAQYIVITTADKMTLQEIEENFYARKCMWILSEKPLGQVSTGLGYYLEFGEA